MLYSHQMKYEIWPSYWAKALLRPNMALSGGRGNVAERCTCIGVVCLLTCKGPRDARTFR